MAATVARQLPAASMMARVDRLDLLLGYLEEMHRNGNYNGNGHASPTNSGTTTVSSPSTPAAAGAGHRGLASSDDEDDGDSAASASTPRRGSRTWRRQPRPAKEVLEEAHAKGSLVDRIAFLEHRVLKMEEGMEITPADMEKTSQLPRAMSKDDPSSMTKKKRSKGLKTLVKSCVRGNLKTKD